MGSFTSTVLSSGYTPAEGAVLGNIRVYGLRAKPLHVTANDIAVDTSHFTYIDGVSLYYQCGSKFYMCPISLGTDYTNVTNACPRQ